MKKAKDYFLKSVCGASALRDRLRSLAEESSRLRDQQSMRVLKSAFRHAEDACISLGKVFEILEEIKEASNVEQDHETQVSHFEM